jgi:CheY-like chemotaxis protein
MHRVRLIHWNAAEAEERADRLRSAGYEVVHEALDAAGLRRLREDPPSAVVIDLSRMPSQGRDVALGIRKTKATRFVPLVFVDGDPAKVARIKEILPDAVYTTWSQIQGSLKRAISHPPADPVVPRTLFDGYAGTPLPKKLGIKAHSVVALVDAPEGFEETLGELPEGVVLRRQARGRRDVTLWFTTSREDLDRRIGQMSAFAAKGGLWIAWPKKSSGAATDLSQGIVRAAGLAVGLVDFKVCAIDATWSGLRFTRRKGAPHE